MAEGAGALKFVAGYPIPLGTLRDWEQGRSEPDPPVKTYLTVVARDPEGVARALQSVPGYVAEAAKIRPVTEAKK
jgi:hypothetical protein